MSKKQEKVIPGSEFSPIFLKLPVNNIVELKFTLESYEGLAIVRTLDSERGHVLVMALEDTRLEVLRVLESIVDDLDVVFMDDAELDSDDWLWESVKAD